MLHLPTLYAVAALLDTFLGALLIASGATGPRAGRARSVALWGAVMLCAAAGMTLGALTTGPFDGFAPPATDALARASRAMMLLASGLLPRAARASRGGRFRPEAALLVPAAWLLALQIPDVGASPALALALYAALGGGATLSAALILRGDEPVVPTQGLAVWLLLAHAAASCIRCVWTLALPGSDALGAAMPSLFVLGTLLFSTGFGCALLSMAKERAELRSLQSVTAARDAAEAASEARVRFLGRVSHELRTPLNGMLGMADLVSADPNLPRHLTAHVQTLTRAGRHLQALVNDLLDLARIDAGRIAIAPRPVRLAQLLDDCVEIVRPGAARRDVTLALETPPGLPDAVLADRTRVQQILLNLLGNAVKFAPASSVVTLGVTVALGGGVLFEVRDQGAGVAPDRLSVLFGAWALPTDGVDEVALSDRNDDGEATGRDDASGAGAGAGLGLAICAGLAAAMGGQIGYRPGPGGVGSAFWVELPLMALGSAMGATLVALPRAGRRRDGDIRAARLG